MVRVPTLSDYDPSIMRTVHVRMDWRIRKAVLVRPWNESMSYEAAVRYFYGLPEDIQKAVMLGYRDTRPNGVWSTLKLSAPVKDAVHRDYYDCFGVKILNKFAVYEASLRLFLELPFASQEQATVNTVKFLSDAVSRANVIWNTHKQRSGDRAARLWTGGYICAYPCSARLEECNGQWLHLAADE